MYIKIEIRELTRDEKKAIRALVVNRCANYHRELKCLYMGDCYMLQKEYCSHSMCRYFRNAVLPNDPELEVALTGKESTWKSRKRKAR